MAGAAEFQLSLLSPKESVEMLITMSSVSVDNAEISTELLNISTLCGRLPLTIGIAAGMIKTFGSDWRGNVLDMLRQDVTKSLAEESGDSLSPAEVIVARSVRELDANSERLLSLLGIVPEDTVCPTSVNDKNSTCNKNT